MVVVVVVGGSARMASWSISPRRAEAGRAAIPLLPPLRLVLIVLLQLLKGPLHRRNLALLPVREFRHGCRYGQIAREVCQWGDVATVRLVALERSRGGTTIILLALALAWLERFAADVTVDGSSGTGRRAALSAAS